MGRISALPQVMLVEDEWITREDLCAEFLEAGWSVVEASSAEEALALYQERPVDVAVIDISLAGNMDGVELANVLRAVGHNGPFVFVSGGPMPKERVPTGSMFRAKPVNPPELICATRRLLEATR